jgi:hypothetical protein
MALDELQYFPEGVRPQKVVVAQDPRVPTASELRWALNDVSCGANIDRLTVNFESPQFTGLVKHLLCFSVRCIVEYPDFDLLSTLLHLRQQSLKHDSQKSGTIIRGNADREERSWSLLRVAMHLFRH